MQGAKCAERQSDARFLRPISPEGFIHIRWIGVTIIALESIRSPHPTGSRWSFKASHDWKDSKTFNITLLFQLGTADGKRMNEEHCTRSTSYQSQGWRFCSVHSGWRTERRVLVERKYFNFMILSWWTVMWLYNNAVGAGGRYNHFLVVAGNSRSESCKYLSITP